MKKMLAILSVAALMLSMAACGGKAPSTTEESTAANVTETVAQSTEAATTGTLKDMKSFSAVCPEDWCRLTYKSNANRLEFYQTPSAPDITKDTPMVKILLETEEEATEEILQNNVKSLLRYSGAKQGQDKKVDGKDFAFVAYQTKEPNHKYYVYTGLVGNHIATITMRDISPNDEQVQSILNSIQFK